MVVLRVDVGAPADVVSIAAASAPGITIASAPMDVTLLPPTGSARSAPSMATVCVATAAGLPFGARGLVAAAGGGKSGVTPATPLPRAMTTPLPRATPGSSIVSSSNVVSAK